MKEGRAIAKGQEVNTGCVSHAIQCICMCQVSAVTKTKELIERKFYWPGLATDVREYILSCQTCQNIAIPRHKPYGKLESLPIPKGLWKEVSLDFITQLPSSYIGMKEYDAILVIVDHYTKFAKFIPTTSDITAAEFTALFHNNIDLQHGSP